MATVIPVHPGSIRKVNVNRDLPAVADLIEVCFASTLDEDGRNYLRHLRWAARDARYLSWLQGAAERVVSPLYGFVWEENGRVVGNLSLIPFIQRGQIIYLIANVAVHPDFRRNGIAHQLTQTALAYLKKRGVSTVWLQVRDDNPVAYHLYRSLGFVDRLRRTTWMNSGNAPMSYRLAEGISIRRRRSSDWEQQLAWLRQTYPPDVIWNLPLSLGRLNPNLANRFMNWLRGDEQEHWVAVCNDRAIGCLAWEPTRMSNDSLWLAVGNDHEAEAVQALLTQARFSLSGRGRPLAVNYPAGQASEAFMLAGFTNHQTLVWMSNVLNVDPSIGNHGQDKE
jgi:ribosomal protein S18 acetylase RimI-like enzyme